MLICERVIIGQDQSATLVRLVDVVIVPSPKAKDDILLFDDLQLFMALKFTIDIEEEVESSIYSVSPSGKRSRIMGGKIRLHGKAGEGTTTYMPLRLKWESEGLYWFEVDVAGTVIAKTPLNLRISKNFD